MKSIKKLLGVLLIGVCLFSFTGCSQSEQSTNEKHTLNALTYAGWNPFAYMNKGEMTGFDIDLIQALSERAGYSITLSNISWEALFEKIRQGQGDLAISGITITPEREKSYAFSVPYFISSQAIITKDPSILSTKDLLSNKIIGVHNGSIAIADMEKLLGENSPYLKKFPTAMRAQMLLSGQIDAYVGDITVLQMLKKTYPEENFRIIYDNEFFSKEYFGILYPKNGDPKIRGAIDKALREMIEDGSYAEIYQKWFGEKPSEELLNQLKYLQ